MIGYFSYIKECREVNLYVQLLRLRSEDSRSLSRLINCTNDLVISLHDFDPEPPNPQAHLMNVRVGL